jgi:hypothetical protein
MVAKADDAGVADKANETNHAYEAHKACVAN